MAVFRAWQKLGVGCARQISVGPNGVPWITGCPGGNPNATGPAWVYYLTWEEGSLIPTPKWNYDNFSAVNIYVNLNGFIYATDSTGAIYQDLGALAQNQPEELYLPSGVWRKVADPAANSFAVTVQSASPGAPNEDEMFYPAQYQNYTPTGTLNGQINIWGTGCDGRDPSTGPFSDRDASLWVMQWTAYWNEGYQPTSWAELPGAAVQISMVTTPGGTSGQATDVKQTPWVVNKEGGLYYFSAVDGHNATYGHDGQWVQINSPAPALYVTDGFLLTTEGVYCTNWNTDPSTWQSWIGFPPDDNGDPVMLKQIAAGGSISAAVIGLPPQYPIFDGIVWTAPAKDQIDSSFGGSFDSTLVWGLDFHGNVYSVVLETVSPIQ